MGEIEMFKDCKHRDYNAIYQCKSVDLIQSHDKHQAVLRPKLINKNDR